MASPCRFLTEHRCVCASKISWATKWQNGSTALSLLIHLSISARDKAVGATMSFTTILPTPAFEPDASNLSGMEVLHDFRKTTFEILLSVIFHLPSSISPGA